MESTAIGGRRGGDACPRPLFFVPGISPANRSYFARFPFASLSKIQRLHFYSFASSVAPLFGHLRLPCRTSCWTGRRAHAPRARPIARHGSSKLGSLRSAAEWSAPSTARGRDSRSRSSLRRQTDDKGGSSIQIPIWRSLQRLRGRSPSFGAKGTRSSWTWTTCSPSGAPPGTRGGTR